ncbi:MAG: hypothetical protein QXJ74_05190 [Nitrososphaera sp.]|uniref:hypothetical protein n=1 Tax=Nitrososphaera sp. TaxID=1971748 RepID=UPI00183FFD63|nr:hypothetical protein [Nitrososphaera sp.]NWG37992.1 hypothetical protein [Nitrososphaera sp.]
MSALLFLLIPAILALIFSVFVAYYAFADVERRLDIYYGYHDRITLNVPDS